MNWSRSSRVLPLVIALVLAAGVAGAVTVSQEDAPPDAEVGSQVTATFVFTDLYETYDEWTLNGTTELEDVTWTVQSVDLSDTVIDEQSYDGQTALDHRVAKDEGVAEVRVQVRGTAPEIRNFTYDPEETFLFAEFYQVRQGGTEGEIDAYRTHHYTAESREARRAIEVAEAAIMTAGGNPQAETTLQNAISAYDAGNFANAISLAEQAEATASRAEQSQQRTQTIIYVVVAVIVLAVIAGAVFWYRSQQTTSRL